MSEVEEEEEEEEEEYDDDDDDDDIEEEEEEEEEVGSGRRDFCIFLSPWYQFTRLFWYFSL